VFFARHRQIAPFRGDASRAHARGPPPPRQPSREQLKTAY